MIKHDRRGHHWKEKVKNGQAPAPWKGVQEWMNKRKQMEEEFKKMAHELSKPDQLPWNESQCYLGQVCKVMWMFLKMSQWTDTVSLEETPGKGLCDITRVVIKDLDKFNEGPFPLLKCKTKSTPEEVKRRQTVLKQWRAAGFAMIPRDDDVCIMQFESEIKEKIRITSTRKRQMHRDAEGQSSRRKKAKVTVDTTAVAKASTLPATKASAVTVPMVAASAITMPMVTASAAIGIPFDYVVHFPVLVARFANENDVPFSTGN